MDQECSGNNTEWVFLRADIIGVTEFEGVDSEEEWVFEGVGQQWPKSNHNDALKASEWAKLASDGTELVDKCSYKE